MKILDCTFRDGGYYNLWDFDPEVVSSYLQAMADAGIDYVELGFRNFPSDGFLGGFAYTTDDYLSRLNLPDGVKYGVMIDAKVLLKSDFSVEKAIERLFVPADQSKISLVRVAAHFSEADKCGEITKKFKEMGYLVGFNLMQSAYKPAETIETLSECIQSWDSVDVLYFADSLGNMNPEEVERVFSAVKKGWCGEIGIHTHDNMNAGLDNTIKALDLGAEWLDMTVTGMGRGAGNTQTELFLAYLEKQPVKYKYNAQAVYELVIRHFEKMQKEYGWGSNLLYFLGAQNDVHPTYIQNLLSNPNFDTEGVVAAIGYLSRLEGTAAYNGAVLKQALDFNVKNGTVSGTKDIESEFDGKNVLIVTNAPNCKKYASEIEGYIKKHNPVVISINIVESISSELIDYYVLSHNIKVLSDIKKYRDLQKPCILPLCRFSEDEKNHLRKMEILDYGLQVEEGVFSAEECFVTVPGDITVAYALGVLLRSTPNSVKVVGFDGYSANDQRQKMMLDILTAYHAISTSIALESLTPTTYPIKQGSIYAPVI